MNELDEILQHAGVKGMKWGVRKKVATVVKNHMKKRKARAKAVLDRYHEKNKNKSSYKKAYNRNLKRTKGNHHRAVAATRAPRVRAQRAIALHLAVHTAPLAIHTGMKIANKARDFAADPDNIRRGKNIIQAMKRSPIRYVDGSKMKNVVMDM